MPQSKFIGLWLVIQTGTIKKQIYDGQAELLLFTCNVFFLLSLIRISTKTKVSDEVAASMLALLAYTEQVQFMVLTSLRSAALYDLLAELRALF